MLLNDFYKDKQTADRIWKEIKFCELMCKLKPKKWQLEDAPKQKVNSYSDSKPQ